MRVGVPKEIKVHEYRVGLTPASVAELVAAGHQVFVQTGAGDGIDCPDGAFRKAGAEILPDAPAVFAASDMIVKVKEPQQSEIALLEPRQLVRLIAGAVAQAPHEPGDLAVLVGDSVEELGALEQVGEAVGLEHHREHVGRVGLVDLDEPVGERAARRGEPPLEALGAVACDLEPVADRQHLGPL